MRKLFFAVLAFMFLIAAAVVTATETRRLGMRIDHGLGVAGDAFLDNMCYQTPAPYYTVVCGVNASHIPFYQDNTASLEPLYPLAAGSAWKLFYTNGDGTWVPIAFGEDNTCLRFTGASSPPEPGECGSGGGSTTLAGLTDVALTSPQVSHVLQYNGSAWVNGTVGVGDMLKAEFAPDGTHVSATAGGTGQNTSSTTGFPRLSAGLWYFDIAATHRAQLGVAIGADVQAYAANLSSLSAPAANTLWYVNSVGNFVSLALGQNGQYVRSNGPSAALSFENPPGGGDVVGPASTADNSVLVADGPTGKLLKSTGVKIENDGLYIPQAATGGGVVIWEASGSGTDYRRVSVPDILSQRLDLRLPNGNPTANQFFFIGAPTDNVSLLSYGSFGAEFTIAAGSVSLTDNVISPSRMNRVDDPADGECLSYDSATQRFEWVTCGTGGGTPGGTDNQIQYKSGSNFAGIPGAGYNSEDNTTTFPGQIKTARSATVSDEFTMYELTGNGDNYVGWKAPDNIATSYRFVFPDGVCSNGQILKAGADGYTFACAADATGGSPSFDLVASGTNTTAAMVVGTGASLDVPTQAVDTNNTKAASTAFVINQGYAKLVSPSFTTPSIGVATGTSLLATGRVDGTASVTLTTGDTIISSTSNKMAYYYNNHGTVGAAVTYTLPTAAAGLQYCVKNYTGRTGVLTLQTQAGNYIDLDGVNTNSGGFIHSGGALGDGACVVGADSTHWVAYVNKGTWTKD